MRLIIVICVVILSGQGIVGRRGGISRGSSKSWGRGSSSKGTSSHSPSHGSTGGWVKPKSPSHSDLPSSNIGPRGYPVQKNQPQPGRLPPPYSPTDPRRMSPPPSYNSIYGPPPAYSNRASYYGVPPQAYPRQNGFGYPGGQTYHPSSYGGINLSPPTNNFNYGYSGSGQWGYQPKQSNSLIGGLGGFFLGYQASSLIHGLSNPWGYGGYGFHNYHRRFQGRKNSTDEVKPCLSYNTTGDLSTPVINPNCTCDPIAFKDTFDREVTQYRCVRKGEIKEDWGKLYKEMKEYAPAYRQYLPPEGVSKGPQIFKLRALTVEAKREEAYSILEKLVNMGKFVVLPTASIPITDGS